MKRIARYPRFVITIFIIVACVFFLTKCIDKEKDKAIPAPTQKISFEQFAGSETCAGSQHVLPWKNISKEVLSLAETGSSMIRV